MAERGMPVVADANTYLSHSAHWGAFQARFDGAAVQVRPHPGDPDPNPIIDNFTTALSHRARVAQPMIRRGWLERGPGADARRGADAFVPVTWDEALDRVAAELQRVKAQHGLEAIFGGSYGWSSAGRFHHAQSQVHRFLNIAVGGYVRSVNTYSAGASEVILPYVLGRFEEVTRRNVTWEQIVEHTDVVLAFGGMALKNSRVAGGGVSRHVERQAMREAAARGCRFINLSPLRSDLPEESRSEWLKVIPGSDTALMLGLLHTLVSAGQHDRAFIERYCTGWATFEDYLLGRSDGTPKSAAWAAPRCGLSEVTVRELAASLAGKRVLVCVAHSLQRAEHGEQPVWMGVALAAALGQIGLPGGGYSYALGTLSHYGRRNNVAAFPALSQGENAVRDYIPVARIADMLLQPGAEYDYNGERRRYPHIRLAYWAGGNPFHHHQDLPRLARAFAQLDTFIVQDSAWTATARHADIVLPCTLTLEREDIAASTTDPLVIAMKRIAPPHAQARDDYAIFCDLAARFGRLQAFSEGRDARGWLQFMYGRLRDTLARQGIVAPDFDSFWARGELEIPQADDDGGVLRAFRADPEVRPLSTPNGKIRFVAPEIAAYGYADCPGHPSWLAPRHAPDAAWPLWLIANQPADKLHSQLDFGAHSVAAKRQGRAVCTLHPAAAAARGIREGDIVRLFNEIGACLASVTLSEGILENAVQLATGAWYDPRVGVDGQALCVHGNPNVLTRDVGTSALAQGTCGQLSTVQIERFDGVLPPVRAFEPPIGPL